MKKVNLIGDMGGPSAFAQRTSLYSSWLGAKMNSKDLSLPKVVMQVLCKLHEQPVDNAVVFTIFERSYLTAKEVALLNRARVVAVPQPLAHVCKKSGVRVPVEAIAYGVADVYQPDPAVVMPGRVFLTAGRPQHGPRKDIQRVIHAFLYATKERMDAVLQVKLPPDAVVPNIRSSHVQYITDSLSGTEMARWYNQGLVFVSPSWGEGWGLHEHEAMACGKAVITTRRTGICSIVPKEGLFVVQSKQVQGYFVPSFESLCDAITTVLDAPQRALTRGHYVQLFVHNRFSLEHEKRSVRKVVAAYA